MTKARILIVEDNEFNRDMLSRRLVKKNFIIDVAEDGQQALDVVSQSRPDLILMDVSLPNMDGWETTRRLKGNDETKDIPIIALTAHAMPEDYQKSMEAGCDDYDTKPVELPRLIEKIKQYLGEVV